ncbi:bi-domain-containing oxidoreductase [Mycolicibacterium sp. D5.8-2]|uniref:bi-domain-containing oxidoreductase n=1 Tax=Mycolicibacterium sp. D5.8-2 TaxID=3085903 RepID=UPI00298C53DA|nr:bi-domain-containing oxidoreductase [Mycolicibacterium sp. D5.8-2]MDW5615078.1 bi-domain-containing oxidoreductase [Mycolicibacterium sp. D5.8-2]
MKQVVQDQARGQVLVIDCPIPQLDDHKVLVKVHRSAISSGTERAKVVLGEKSLLGKARARPQDVAVVREALRREGVRRTIEKVQDRLHTLQPLGYSASGVIVDIGKNVNDLRVGMRVAISGAGVANHAEYDAVPSLLCTPLPDNVTFDDGAFVTLGSIALQGIRQADVRPGEKCLIVGLGLIGQLTARLLDAYGSPSVGVDPKQAARELSAQALVMAVPTLDESVGHDFDHVIVTASSSDEGLVRRAATHLRDRGTITVVGDVPLMLDRNEFFNGEHDLRISRSYGPGRYDPEYEEQGKDYPIGYVRWTEGRNFVEIVRLLAAGRLEVASLVEQSFSVDDASAAYAHLKAQPGPGAITLTYAVRDPEDHTEIVTRQPANLQRKRGTLGVGVIGAGSYARKFVLPKLARDPRVSLESVVTASGLSAVQVRDKFGVSRLASSASDVIGDSRIQAVVISTRHDSHGRLVKEALDREKWVYVDKPLCITEEERVDIAGHPLRHQVVVGFNRRAAPAMDSFRSHAFGLSGLQIIYRVTPDAVSHHWSQSSEQGGRIIGEVCHFVDFAVSLLGVDLETVYASGPTSSSGAAPDRVQIQMAWRSGGSAQISYGPSASVPDGKERIELSGPDWFAEISRDFRRLHVWSGKTGRVHKFSSDKGQSALVGAFVGYCVGEVPSPVPFEEADLSTRATFEALNSLRASTSRGL